MKRSRGKEEEERSNRKQRGVKGGRGEEWGEERGNMRRRKRRSVIC